MTEAEQTHQEETLQNQGQIQVLSDNQEDAAQTTNEWTTAALAHASVLLTLFLALAGGVGSLVGLIIPLAIYLGYRDRSSFIAFHALQAFTYQALGLLIYVVLAVILALGVTLAWTISGILSAILIGLLMMPFALLLTVFMVILLIGAPLAWLGYGLYAAYEVYQGQNFRYWQIGEWLEQEVKL